MASSDQKTLNAILRPVLSPVLSPLAQRMRTFSNRAWPSNLETRWLFSGGSGGATRTRINETNPSGHPVVTRFVRTSEGTTQYGIYYGNNEVFITGNVYTCSLWMRGLVGGERIRFAIEGSAEGNNHFVTLTTSWKRYAVTAVKTTTTGTFVAYMQDGGIDAGFLVAGGQIEQAGTVGPFIMTTAGAVTKAYPL